jgi:hypothetical protein
MAEDRTNVGEKRDLGPTLRGHRIVEEGRRFWSNRPTSEGKVSGIPFGAPGSWQECVDRVGPHLGEGAKGYCSLRYHEATGRWPGSGHHNGGK